jgi:hypothetical protein
MAGVTVTEKITFTDGHEVDRTMPIILNDGRLSLNTWNKFCDECDDAMKPMQKIKIGLSIIWALIIVFFVLCGSGWMWIDNVYSYYAIIGPVTVVAMIVLCKFEDYRKQKCASKLMRVCSDISNNDKNLKMTLSHPQNTDCKNWYITVLISNFNDMINGYNITDGYDYDDIESTPIVASTAVPVHVPAVVVAAASAIPVVATASTIGGISSTASSSSSPPKKYIKDEENPGALTLNPEYKVWMKANGN